MAKFRIGDLVIIDKDYAEEYELYSGVMKVKEIHLDRCEYILSALGDENVGVLMHMALEDKINPCNILYPSEKLLSSRTVSILGTTYTIQELSVAEDISLKDCDGYCDKTDKRIVIAKKESDCDLGDFEQHRKKTMRHEIIHAYFNESGLAENFENKHYGVSETLVDWFAIQSPKIYKTFAELDIL